MTRKSKIARLPRSIRDELNRRLDNGDPGIRLVKWLNELPEVKEVLARDFEGRAITPQNLSEWKSGGYEDWLEQQNTQMSVQELIADAQELSEVPAGELTKSLSNLVTVHYACSVHRALGRLANEQNPLKKLRLVIRMLNDVIRLRRCEDAREHAEVMAELDQQRLELHRERLELDRQRLELARQKSQATLRQTRALHSEIAGSLKINPSSSNSRNAEHSSLHPNPPKSSQNKNSSFSPSTGGPPVPVHNSQKTELRSWRAASPAKKPRSNHFFISPEAKPRITSNKSNNSWTVTSPFAAFTPLYRSWEALFACSQNSRPIGTESFAARVSQFSELGPPQC